MDTPFVLWIGRTRSRCPSRDSLVFVPGSDRSSDTVGHFLGIYIPNYTPCSVMTEKPIFIPKRTGKRTRSTPHCESTRTSKKESASPPKSQPSKRKKNTSLSQQERKEQGLCRCGQAAIHGQTRCDKCAEKHRAWHREYAEKRRRARGAQPRPRNDDTELLEQVRIEIAAQNTRTESQKPKRVRGEAFNRQMREKQAQERAERKSLGLCVQCGKPNPEDQTRCAECAARHRYYGRRKRARAKVLKESQPSTT